MLWRTIVRSGIEQLEEKEKGSLSVLYETGLSSIRGIKRAFRTLLPKLSQTRSRAVSKKTTSSRCVSTTVRSSYN